MRRLRFLLTLLLVSARGLAAQASLVPVSHPIYDWLLEQRIEGRLPTYQYEVRPMSRATIVGHLKTLAAMEDRLSNTERKLLTDFRNEFEMDRLVQNRGWTRGLLHGLPGSVPAAIRDRRDPVLVAHEDSLISYALYAFLGGGLLSLNDSSGASSSYATSEGIRAMINTSFGLGWHFEEDNLWTANAGNLVKQVPRYDSNALKVGSTASYEYDSFLSYSAKRWFSLSAGWGGQALGVSLTDPLVLRPDAPFFGSVRLELGGPRLQFVYVHGALSAPTVLDSTGPPLTPAYNRTAPDRFFVAHRLTWMPVPRLSLAIHEETIYANRGPDLNYLNPAVPMVMAQLRLGDRDNLLAGGEAVYRPVNGTELRASLLIDDVQDSWGPAKKALLVAVEQRLMPGLRFGAGYIETDPWMYSHWQYNDVYENDGKPLGTSLGPNGEELSARLTAWLPLRTHIMAGYRHIKRGLDPVAADSDYTKCVGGNLFCGANSLAQPKFNVEERLYAGADIQSLRRLEFEAVTEPVRGFPLIFNFYDDKVLHGTRLHSRRFAAFRYRFGF